MSKPEEIRHKDYVIEPCSEEAFTEDDQPVGWLPRIGVRWHPGDRVYEKWRTLYKPYPTREQADQAAVRWAMWWIDKQEGR